MSLNAVPSSERTHIGLFGKRNAGKSSLINAITGQDLAIVSDVKGTTTDPVSKVMELLPLGPVVLIDTPGLDDHGELGAMRVEKSYQVIGKSDIALLVVDSCSELSSAEQELITRLRERNLPYLIVHNKADLLPALPETTEHDIWVSAKTKEHIWELKEKLAAALPELKPAYPIVGDLLLPGEVVILVMPQDVGAPKGRLILPQQQTIREVIDAHATAFVIQPEELVPTLAALKAPPRMVITDSQVFKRVAKDLPDTIPLTSFSILMARHKGILADTVKGIRQLDSLATDDKILICEGCTHHRQCEDIGTVKLPKWISDYTGKQFRFTFTSGGDFPRDLADFKLVIHCGGCVLNEQEVRNRLRIAKAAGVPMTNYGLAIAQMNGILERSLTPFADLQAMLQ